MDNLDFRGSGKDAIRLHNGRGIQRPEKEGSHAMTAERYTPAELPGVIERFRFDCQQLERIKWNSVRVSVDVLNRLLATLEAMAAENRKYHADQEQRDADGANDWTRGD